MGNKALTSFAAVFIMACFLAPFAGEIKDRWENFITQMWSPQSVTVIHNDGTHP